MSSPQAEIKTPKNKPTGPTLEAGDLETDAESQ